MDTRQLITADERWSGQVPFPGILYVLAPCLVIMAISVVPVALRDLAEAVPMFVDLVNDIFYVNVAPTGWVPSASLHPDASLFVLFALVASFVLGQGMLSEVEGEDLDSDDAPVETPQAVEEESVPILPPPSRPPPVSPGLIRAWRKKMKEAAKQKAERLRARSARKHTVRQSNEESSERGDVQEAQVEPETSSVPHASTSRYVDVGVQTDVPVGVTPEPVQMAAEPELASEQRTTAPESGSLEVADHLPTALEAVGVDESYLEDSLDEGSVGSDPEDQTWGGSPNGVSVDEESEEGDRESAIFEEAEHQGDEEQEEEEEEEEQESEEESEEEGEPMLMPVPWRKIAVPRGRLARLAGSDHLEKLKQEMEAEKGKSTAGGELERLLRLGVEILTEQVEGERERESATTVEAERQGDERPIPMPTQERKVLPLKPRSRVSRVGTARMGELWEEQQKEKERFERELLEKKKKEEEEERKEKEKRDEEEEESEEE